MWHSNLNQSLANLFAVTALVFSSFFSGSLFANEISLLNEGDQPQFAVQEMLRFHSDQDVVEYASHLEAQAAEIEAAWKEAGEIGEKPKRQLELFFYEGTDRKALRLYKKLIIELTARGFEISRSHAFRREQLEEFSKSWQESESEMMNSVGVDVSHEKIKRKFKGFSKVLARLLGMASLVSVQRAAVKVNSDGSLAKKKRWFGLETWMLAFEEDAKNQPRHSKLSRFGIWTKSLALRVDKNGTALYKKRWWLFGLRTPMLSIERVESDSKRAGLSWGDRARIAWLPPTLTSLVYFPSMTLYGVSQKSGRPTSEYLEESFSSIPYFQTNVVEPLLDDPTFLRTNALLVAWIFGVLMVIPEINKTKFSAKKVVVNYNNESGKAVDVRGRYSVYFLTSLGQEVGFAELLTMSLYGQEEAFTRSNQAVALENGFHSNLSLLRSEEWRNRWEHLANHHRELAESLADQADNTPDEGARASLLRESSKNAKLARTYTRRIVWICNNLFLNLVFPLARYTHMIFRVPALVYVGLFMLGEKIVSEGHLKRGVLGLARSFPPSSGNSKSSSSGEKTCRFLLRHSISPPRDLHSGSF